ncbi:hypothetical protein PMAYCL1PPCAC_31397, partial [Pristionchus mayeri]
VILVFGVIIYRPLPDKLAASTTSDRVTIHIFDPLARLFYYYPTRYLCPSADCRLQWMRKASALLKWIVGPSMDDNDPHLHMETTHWDGVKVRIYYPRDIAAAESDGAILYTHGGGFSIWDTKIYESLTRKLAQQMSTRLFVSIDYRLAPETPFPGAIDDCERVLEYIIAHGPQKFGIDPKKIVVMGDSAGGNLAAVISQRRTSRGSLPKILGQALLYPWLQMSDLQSPSYRYWNREMDKLTFLDPLTLAHFTLWYAGIDVQARPDFAQAMTEFRHYMDYSLLPGPFQDKLNCTDFPKLNSPIQELSDSLTPFLTDPDFAPLMQPDLSNLPPALVLTCEFDVLIDEGVIYAQRLKQAGVPTRWVHSEHGFHGMLSIHSRLDVAQ